MTKLMDSADLERLTAMRFILQFDQGGGLHFGVTGFTETGAYWLDQAGVISVGLYKPVSSTINRWGRRKAPRRFRSVVAGPLMPRLAVLLREELRNRNLPTITGHDDGLGRVAFKQAWNAQRPAMKDAMRQAWTRLQAEQVA